MIGDNYDGSRHESNIIIIYIYISTNEITGSIVYVYILVRRLYIPNL